MTAETMSQDLRCACPGCENPLSRVRTAGKVQRFCSPKCRNKDYMLRHPRAARTAILQPGYVALPASTVVQPEGAGGVQAATLVSDVAALPAPCAPISGMLVASLEARLAELEKRPVFGRSSGQDATKWKHGANCYRNHGCRCVTCVEGNRARLKGWRQTRRKALAGLRGIDRG